MGKGFATGQLSCHSVAAGMSSSEADREKAEEEEEVIVARRDQVLKGLAEHSLPRLCKHACSMT